MTTNRKAAVDDIRSKKGVEAFKVGHNNDFGLNSSGFLVENPNARIAKWNSTGKHLAISLPNEVKILECTADDNEGKFHELCHIPLASSDIIWSPSGTLIGTFERLKDRTLGEQSNIKIWKILEHQSECPTRISSGFSHQAQGTWSLQWTADESYMARLASGGGELHFYRMKDFEMIGPSNPPPPPTLSVKNDNIGSFSLSPGPYPKLAIFVRGTKGAPSAVKIYLLPNKEAPVVQKTFFRADRCQLEWSPNGKHLLALTQTEIDVKGDSYYGESSLYFISGDGSFDCRVDLDKGGPIHDISWSPHSNEFIVLYGFMPSKAMLFDVKCNPTFEFPVGSKNHVRWNPSGSLICFGGFGNLPGHIEVWSRSKSLRRVGHFQSQGASICEWSPDGAMLVTATVTPRLRVDNGFKVWRWDGSMLGEFHYEELYSVNWRWENPSRFPIVDVSSVPCVASGPLESDASAKKQAYVPPGLRNKKMLESSPTPNPVAPKPAPVINAPSALSKEEKMVRKLREKLDQILSLKVRHEKGELLELNQLEKIQKEQEVRTELATVIDALNKKTCN